MNDPIADSINNAMVLVVCKGKSKAWPQALNILNTLDIQPNDDDEWHFVVKKDPVSFAKAISIIELLHHTKSLFVYSNGLVVDSYNIKKLVRMGQCYIWSFKADNWKSYCHCIHEYGIFSDNDISIPFGYDDPDEPIDEDKVKIVERAIIPCSMIYDSIKYDLGDKYECPEKILSLIVSSGFDLCPRFNHKEHLEIMPRRILINGKVDTDKGKIDPDWI